MARYLARLGTEVERRVELVAFEQDEDAQRFSLPTADRKRPTSPISSPATAPTVRFARHSVSRSPVTIIPPIS